MKTTFKALVVSAALFTVTSASADYLHDVVSVTPVQSKGPAAVRFVEADLLHGTGRAGFSVVRLEGEFVDAQGHAIAPRADYEISGVELSILSQATIIGVPIYLEKRKLKNLIGITSEEWVLDFARMRKETEERTQALSKALNERQALADELARVQAQMEELKKTALAKDNPTAGRSPAGYFDSKDEIVPQRNEDSHRDAEPAAPTGSASSINH